MTLRRPRRLPNVSYVGMQRYSLTLCTFQRHPWFTDASVVEHVRSLLLETAVAEKFGTPAFCFMPDHLHILAEGTSPDSDLPHFMSSFKQRSGFWFSRQRHERLWQDGFYDHILRDDETTLTVVRYILENPLRAKLVTSFLEYPYSGSDQYSLIELAEGVSEGLSPACLSKWESQG